MTGLGKKFYIFIGFLISAVCLFFAFRGIHWTEVASTLKKANLWLLIIAVLFQLLALVVAGLRWKKIINLSEISWSQASGSMIVGFLVNNILPGRMGELVRPVLLSRETQKSRAFLFGTVVLDRTSDLLVLVILAMCSFGIFPFLPWARELSIVGGIVLLALLLSIGLFSYSTAGPKIEKIVYRWSPPRIGMRAVDLLQKLRQGFRSIGSVQQGMVVFFLSCVLWTAAFFSLYYTLDSFGLGIPVLGVVLLLAVLNLGSLIPSSPGYAGTYHLLAIAVLSTFAIRKADALGFILVFHAVWYVPQTLLGLIILIQKNIRLGQLMER